jgi:hypothetical protein
MLSNSDMVVDTLTHPGGAGTAHICRLRACSATRSRFGFPTKTEPKVKLTWLRGVTFGRESEVWSGCRTRPSMLHLLIPFLVVWYLRWSGPISAIITSDRHAMNISGPALAEVTTNLFYITLNATQNNAYELHTAFSSLDGERTCGMVLS